MKKQGKIGAWGIFGFIVLGVVLFGGTMFSIVRWGIPQQTAFPQTEFSEEGEPQGIILTTSSLCPTTGKTSIYVRAEDTEAGSYTTFASKTVYLLPVKGATGEDADTRDPTEPLYTMSTSSGTSGNWSSSQDVTCEKYFKAILVDVITSSGHAESKVFKAVGQAVYIGEAMGLQAPAISGLQARVHDIGNDVYYETETSVSTFSNLPVTFINVSDTGGANNFTTNTVYDFEFLVKTQTANTKGGQSDCYVLADADATDYQEPAVSYKSTDLTDVFDDALNSNDKSVLSGWEYAYKVDPMSNSLSKVYASIQSKTDIHPDVNLKFRFACKGKYKSNEDTDKINIGIFQDGSTNTEVVLNNATIDIKDIA